MSGRYDPNRPWADDPAYGGMSPGSAEKSWRAAQKHSGNSNFALADTGEGQLVLVNQPAPGLLRGLRDESKSMTHVAEASIIRATPYVWTSTENIPARSFIYGEHLIRKFVSATVAPGGVGKTSLVISDVLAMVSGKDLIGIVPKARLKVWLWNLEDPFEELQRRIQAAALHFKLMASDLNDHLFIDSGRDQRLVIATVEKNQTVIHEPIVDSLVAEIKARDIDVLIVDPFVSSHTAPENDNNAMDRIVKEWGRVADQGNCAVELVHHARKSSAGETEITVESARGGKAFADGCRSVRILNRMSKEEGLRAAVENPRLYFRTYTDKSTLSPPAAAPNWFKLENVELGNGPTGCGDSVGVVISWQWSDLAANVSASDLRRVQSAISAGHYRASPQAKGWVGDAIAEALGFDLAKRTDRRKAVNLLKAWLASGALKQVNKKDRKGMLRPCVVVGKWAND